MSDKHTAGPWTAALGKFDFGNDGSRRIMVGLPDDESYRRIGTVDPVAPRKDRGKDKTPYNAPDDERDANARLIAAAPQLLEALREARERLHKVFIDGGGCDHGVGICWCDEARALEQADNAIALATSSGDGS